MELHGFSWSRSFQFVDRTDENDFRAVDFESMLPAHLLTIVSQFVMIFACILAYDLPSTPLGRTQSWLLPQLFVVLAAQVGIRTRLFNGQPGRLGWYFVWGTCIEWVGLAYADLHHGFVILQSDTMFILLFFCCFMCQAILIFHAWAYFPPLMLFSVVFAPCVVATHLHLSRPDPTKPMLMTPVEFFAMSCLIMVFAATFIGIQLHTRRLHHAALQRIAELLRCEKERLGYELAFVRQQSEQPEPSEFSEHGAPPRGSESDAGGGGSAGGAPAAVDAPRREAAQPARALARGPRSYWSARRGHGPGSSGASSGMSELEHAVTELAQLTAPSQQRVEAFVRCVTPPPTPSSLARDEVLWRTLDQCGIVPTDLELNGHTGSLRQRR